ncbi:hypothetical protein [Staphylothermus hellenicus]|uniref:Uncharacterized protein n=1 Tax=Staphylothermus hellenicus (strain DSM 12710 / JCM 10830 / BK20S6-10-b1 / P8) TaxID=591019 RepID=D7DCD5_STAHD|nr:hypothetical protein [Staphylothermus hellenicus]ADI31832.1 hypothetical protein Shell_0711 [Staphylothermus hellenicus DSM 12710]
MKLKHRSNTRALIEPVVLDIDYTYRFLIRKFVFHNNIFNLTIENTLSKLVVKPDCHVTGSMN